MPATVTLGTTTLASEESASDTLVKVADNSGLTPGMALYCDGELMRVVSLGAGAGEVNVIRGIGGTGSRYHDPGAVCYSGLPHQFYRQNPLGSPPETVEISPWINITDGNVWFAEGDPLKGQYRWWQKQATVYGQGALGIRTFTSDPTSST